MSDGTVRQIMQIANDMRDRQQVAVGQREYKKRDYTALYHGCDKENELM